MSHKRTPHHSFLRQALVWLAMTALLVGCDTLGGGLNTGDTVDQSGEIDAMNDMVDDQVTDGDSGDSESETTDSMADVPPGDDVYQVVISFPFGADDGIWFEVYELTADLELTATGNRFQMGRSNFREITFSPDGTVGMVTDDDGGLGIFRFDEDNTVTVVEPAYTGNDAFYAEYARVHPDGTRIWLLDANFPENGGGLFEIGMAADGSPSSPTLVAPTKLAYGFELVDDTTIALAATEFSDLTTMGDDAHLVDLGMDPFGYAGADFFPDDEEIVSAVAITNNKQHFLVADNSGFSGVPNRVAVGAIDGLTLSPVQTLSPFNDPADVIISPYDNAALVTALQEDAIYALSYDPNNAAAPFAIEGELDYAGAGPELPASGSLITSGPLADHVIIAENTALRVVRFNPDGTLTDRGAIDLGEGSEAIPGSIGVRP